jgi:hypothetical protein
MLPHNIPAEKCKNALSAGKIMAAVIWDDKHVTVVNVLSRSTTEL